MILHLSTQQTGGAAIAALRLHKALTASGIDSHFLSLSGSPQPDQHITVVNKIYERYWQRGLYKLGIAANQYRKWQQTRSNQRLPATVLSGIRSDYRLSTHPLVQQADLIHLHWVNGMFDWPDFFGNIQKPIVWTLHDMNPFMGIFHYDGDLARANDRSKALEAEIKLQKAKLLAKQRDLICVAPSNWLSEKASSSEVLGKFQHRVIRNSIDTSVFRSYPQSFGREVFNLPVHAKLLLVVAENLSDVRKGMDLLREGINQSDLDEAWEVIAVGRGGLGEIKLKCHDIGVIADERLMALLYSTADLFVIPSREDNLPNTILESLSCGTPVVGLPTGGIPEAIESPNDGVLATEISSEALGSALDQASKLHSERSHIRMRAVRRFGEESIAEKYAQLYDQLAG